MLIKLGPWKVREDTLPRRGFGYRPGMRNEELYDSTRAWWVISRKRAMTYPWFVAVYAGITRGVWEFDDGSWHSTIMELADGKTQQRWAFAGQPAPPHIHEAFVGRIGRRIPARPARRPVFGSGSVIAYWPS